MAKYLSGKFKTLKVGIASYSDDKSSLQIVGSATFNGITTISSSGILVGGSGILTATQLSLGAAGTISNHSLDIENIKSGVITATKYYGDGSDLVGITTAGADLIPNSLDVVGLSTFNQNIEAKANLDVDGHTELDDVNVSGAITATTFTGNLAGTVNTSAQPNITLLGILTSLDVNGHTELDNVNISGFSTFNQNTNVGSGITLYASSGIISATEYYGDGSKLVGTGDTTNVATNSLYVSGISTLGITSATDLEAQQLNVTGIATITDLNVSGIVTSDLVPGGTYDLGSSSSKWDKIYANEFVGAVAGVVTHADSATSVEGGIATVTTLYVSGISTVGYITATNSFVGAALTIGGNVNIVEDAVTSNSGRLYFGADNDLSLYFNGADSYVEGENGGLILKTIGAGSTVHIDANNESLGKFVAGGSAELYYRGDSGAGKKFETSGIGVTITGITSTTDIYSTGISTLTNVNITGFTTINQITQVGSAITLYPATGIISATQFWGGGENITDVISAKIKGISVKNEGVVVGSADSIRFINFVGSPVSATGSGAGSTVTISPEIGSDGSVNTTGIITASSFSGSGAKLTGVGGTWGVDSVGVSTTKNVGIGTTAKNGFALDVNGHTELDNLNISGFSTFNSNTNVGSAITLYPATGIVSATTFIGSVIGDTGIHVPENQTLTVGIGTTNLTISHNTVNSSIKHNNHASSGLYLQSNKRVEITNEDATKVGLRFNHGGNHAIELFENHTKRFETTSSGAVVSGMLTATTYYGSGQYLTDITTDQWAVSGAGIHTTKNVGLGTTNPQTPLQVKRYGIDSGIGTWTASAGVAHTVNELNLANLDAKTVEYILHVENQTNAQTEKILIMNNQGTAYSQEFGIVFNDGLIVSAGATIASNILKLELTPETGISNMITYKFARTSVI